MMIKAINKALAGGMGMPEVKEALRKCGYGMTVTTEVNMDLLDEMDDIPEPNNPDHESYLDYPERSDAHIDGGDFFDMATRGVGIYRRVIIRKMWNPNFVSAMSKLGSPLGVTL